MILYALYEAAIFYRAIPTYGVLPYSMIVSSVPKGVWSKKHDYRFTAQSYKQLTSNKLRLWGSVQKSHIICRVPHVHLVPLAGTEKHIPSLFSPILGFSNVLVLSQ